MHSTLASNGQSGLMAMAIVMGVIVLIVMVAFYSVLRPWLRATLSGVRIDMARIVGMRLRGNSPILLIDAYLELKHSGHEVDFDTLEHIYLANKSRIRNAGDLVHDAKESPELRDDE